MKDGETTVIEEIVYRYDKFYDRLQVVDGFKTIAEIACPRCHNTTFKINYGSHACVANCECGHSMTVYDG